MKYVFLFLFISFYACGFAQGFKLTLEQDVYSDSDPVKDVEYHIPDTMKDLGRINIKFDSLPSLQCLWVDFGNGHKIKLWLTHDHKLFYHRHYGSSNELEGTQYYYDDHGILSCIVNYKEGKHHGSRIDYYPNGRIRFVGQYEEAKPIGIWYHFDEKGTLILQEDRSVIIRGTDDLDYWLD